MVDHPNTSPHDSEDPKKQNKANSKGKRASTTISGIRLDDLVTDDFIDEDAEEAMLPAPPKADPDLFQTQSSGEEPADKKPAKANTKSASTKPSSTKPASSKTKRQGTAAARAKSSSKSDPAPQASTQPETQSESKHESKPDSAPQPAVPSPLIIPAAPHAVSAARVKKKAPAQQVGGEDKAQATNNQPLLETLIAEHGIGHAIATFRQNAGVSLAEISDDLKISQSHLINLESQQFDRLPNRAYAVGFVRSIARYLKLDDGYLVDKFKAHWDMPEEIQPPEFLQPINQWNISGFWLVAATLIALVGGYYGWKTLTQSEFTIPQPALIADKAPVNENTVNKNIADDPIMPAPAARPAPEAIMPEPIMPEILINEESQSAPAAAIIQEIIVGDATTDQPPQQAPAPDLSQDLAPEPELIVQEIPEPDIAQPISSVNIIQLKAIRSSWLQLETVAGDIIFEGIIAQNDMIDIDGQHRISFSDGEALALIYRNENKGLLFDYMGRSAYAMLFDPASFADQP